VQPAIDQRLARARIRNHDLHQHDQRDEGNGHQACR
jgi:hypothetical protein